MKSNNYNQVITNTTTSVELTSKQKRQAIIDSMPEGKLKEMEKGIEKTFDSIEATTTNIDTSFSSLSARLDKLIINEVKHLYFLYGVIATNVVYILINILKNG